jgi:hypothetical protein
MHHHVQFAEGRSHTISPSVHRSNRPWFNLTPENVMYPTPHCREKLKGRAHLTKQVRPPLDLFNYCTVSVTVPVGASAPEVPVTVIV